MQAMVRFFTHIKRDDITRDFPTLAHARGTAKLALRHTPFHWEWARVFYTDDAGTSRYVDIRKGQGEWIVTDEVL